MAVLKGAFGGAIGFLRYLRLINFSRIWKPELARVARLIEQSFENPSVGGSVPPLGAMLLTSVIDHFTERISKK